MVGRLIVGKPSGPGSMSFDWFKDSTEGRDWLEVPPDAQRSSSVEEILVRKVVPPRSI
jgi:hypothetical protein